MEFSQPTPVMFALSGMFLLLIVSSTVLAGLMWARPQKNWTELRQRTLSWWVMTSLFAAAVILDTKVMLALGALVSFLALKEYLSLIPTRRVDRRILLWAYLAVPLQYLWIGLEWYGMFIVFIPVFVFLFIPMRMVLVGETRGFLGAVGTVHWGLMITVFSLSHAAYLVVLPGETGSSASGAALAIYLVMLTQLNDVAQFLWGKTFGQHKAIPTVSPNKTMEGLVGGVMSTVLLATWLGPWMTPLTPVQSMMAGLIIGLGGFVGDVTLSAFKRDLGIKDTSQLLPGHGGILDRVDSMVYTAPLFFHFVRYLQ